MTDLASRSTIAIVLKDVTMDVDHY